MKTNKLQVATISVVGANGSMGAGIAGVFAAFGQVKAYLICRDMNKANIAVEKAYKSIRSDVIKCQLIPADFSMLEECIKDSDLVFESTAENIEIKKEVTKKIAKYINSSTIVCSGTSGLSVTTLAECLKEGYRGNYFGVHMFNPPYMMSLCELIPTKYSNIDTQNKLHKYLEEVLLRTVIVIKDSPAFLSNRIGLQFINEALIYAEKFGNEGGIDYIDAILGPFTGRALAPLVTSDFIGLDVHKAIVDNIYYNTKDYANDSFVFPSFAEELIKQNKLGRKTGAGLYKTEKDENGNRRVLVYDIINGTYRDKKIYKIPFAEKMKSCIEVGDYVEALRILVEDSSKEAQICLRFLLHYIMYSLITTKEVSEDIHAADDAMAAGYNWVPPIGLANVLSKIKNIKDLVTERLEPSIVEIANKEGILDNIPLSKYDYRPYFKATK